MGKPSTSPVPGLPGRAGSSLDGDAVSLHTQPGDRAYADDVPELQTDDMPPLYSDIEPDADHRLPLLPNTEQADYVIDALRDGRGRHEVDASSKVEFFMHPLLDAEPRVLEQQIKLSATKPPRPFVRILGTHCQMVEEKGKREKKTVTDFDVSVELTPYLFSDPVKRESWTELRTVENHEKARRGTILRKRAPGVKQDIEITDAKPTLLEWCHRYCASHAGVKQFALQKHVTGFDEAQMKEQLMTLVRGTNYRGSIQITFPVTDNLVLVFNECKVNRWRLTPWIVWMCYLTFLWLFTWPFLFFRTKKFEVVIADWPFSTPGTNQSKLYVSMSEAHIYNLWGRAISRAVLDKRQGTLDQADLIASQTTASEPFANVLEGAPRFLREGINAITAVNRQLGWGGDSY